MGLTKTYFSYFHSFCTDRFGRDIANALNEGVEVRLSRMMNEADYKNNKYIKWHMDTNMLPVIAIYLSYKDNAYTADKAYEYTDEVMQILRLKNRRNNQPAGKLPFGYFIFKLFCRSIVKKQYPSQGWDLEWIEYSKHELHFNMKSCIYLETTKKYHCPELCPLFCANDDVVLSGYRPAIVFERSGTLAQGQDGCDFHFKNPKYI